MPQIRVRIHHFLNQRRLCYLITPIAYRRPLVRFAGESCDHRKIIRLKIRTLVLYSTHLRIVKAPGNPAALFILRP